MSERRGRFQPVSNFHSCLGNEHKANNGKDLDAELVQGSWRLVSPNRIRVLVQTIFPESDMGTGNCA
jgi:hypothetical protein